MEDQFLLPKSSGNQLNYLSGEGREKKPKLYKRRWIMLVLLTLLTAENVSQWLFYSAMDNIIRYHFNVSSFLAQLLSLNNFAIIMFFGLPSIYIVDKTDLKAGCLTCGFLSLTALWLKFFGTHSGGFYISLLGQILASLGTCFVLPLPAQLAATWFGVTERSVATSIAASGTPFGMGFAYLFASQFVPDTDDHKAIQYGLRRSLLIQAIISSLTIIATVFAFEIEPSSPPSASQAAIDHNEQTKRPFRECVQILCGNKSFIFTLLSFGMITGVFYTFFSLLNDIVLWRFPDEEHKMGWMGFLGSIVGIPGMFFTGYLLDRTKAFKKTFLTYTACIAITLLGFTFSVKYSTQVWLPFILIAAFGFIVSGLTTTAFVLGAELTYPKITEVLSSGVLLFAGQFFGVLILGINSYAVSADSVEFVNWFMTAACFIAFFFTPFIKPDYRRLAKDTIKVEEQFFD